MLTAIFETLISNSIDYSFPLEQEIFETHTHKKYSHCFPLSPPHTNPSLPVLLKKVPLAIYSDRAGFLNLLLLTI